eukprot:scaffold1163_cov370-Pavlova_lutheri.AAC.3
MATLVVTVIARLYGRKHVTTCRQTTFSIRLALEDPTRLSPSFFLVGFFGLLIRNIACFYLGSLTATLSLFWQVIATMALASHSQTEF